MKRFLLVVAAVLLLAGVSLGSSYYVDGYVDSNGYTWRDNYWWYNGQAYTRTATPYYQSGYYYCGHWYPGYTYYRYSYYPVATISAATGDWRSGLIGIAAYRDKVEGRLREKEQEQKHFLQGVSAFGLTGNFNWQGYGQAIDYGGGIAQSLYGNGYGYSLPAIGNYGASGNTQYAVTSYNSIADGYGTSLPVLYQGAIELAKQSNDVGRQATDGVLQITSQVGAQQSRVAEILAKGQAVERAFRAVAPAASQSVTTYRSGASYSSASGQANSGGLVNLTPAQRSAASYCIACHGDNSPKGNYRVSQHWTLSPAQQNEIVDRHLLADPTSEEFMPRADAGHAGGTPLPQEVIRAFMATTEQARGR